MGQPENYFAWCDRIACPPSICTDGVKKILRKGLMELLWDDIATTTYPAQQALLIRKNILLYKLRQNMPSKVMQCMKDISLLTLERNKLERQISETEEKYEEQDFIVRQKAQKLKDIKSMHFLHKIRKELLNMKQSQMATQLQDCINMRLVCQRFMPCTSKDLDSRTLREILNVVSTLCSGANKKEVWNKISTTFYNIETSTLWLHMYQSLIEDVNKLSKLEVAQIVNSKKFEDSIDVDIAKMCGQHVCTVLNQCLYSGRANKIQQRILELIEQVEIASDESTDVSKWLMLALEVRKLEIEQMSFQSEIDTMQDNINKHNTLTFDLAQLTSSIENINLEIEQHVRDIQQSLIVLKASPKSINTMKEKLYSVLQKIVALRAMEYDPSWLRDDLNTELDLFFDGFDINALRKIMLKGDIGSYRHTKCCFSEASVSITSSQGANIKSYFPMIYIPIYYLIECCKHLTISFTYNKLEALQSEDSVDLFEIPIAVPENAECNALELLNSSKTVCERTKKEIDQFNKVFNAWRSQNVQRAMDITERTIDGLPFQDWVQRYSLLLYMIQNAV